jgi:hypothetical protein
MKFEIRNSKSEQARMTEKLNVRNGRARRDAAVLSFGFVSDFRFVNGAFLVSVKIGNHSSVPIAWYVRQVGA